MAPNNNLKTIVKQGKTILKNFNYTKKAVCRQLDASRFICNKLDSLIVQVPTKNLNLTGDRKYIG